MATIYIDKKYTNLCRQFCDDRDAKTQEKTFRTYMDLAVFAALVGFQKERIKVENNGPEIPDSVFFNNRQEGLVYLFALIETEDPYILKEDRQCWKIFEDYVNAGMYEIAGWLADNPTDAFGTDTLLNAIAEKATALIDQESESIDIPPNVF